MSVMLLAMVAAAGVGLLSREFGRREFVLCTSISVGLTLLYFFRPIYMT